LVRLAGGLAGVPPRARVGERVATAIAIVARPAETNLPAFNHATFAVHQENSFILYPPECQPDYCALPCFAAGAPGPATR